MPRHRCTITPLHRCTDYREGPETAEEGIQEGFGKRIIEDPRERMRERLKRGERNRERIRRVVDDNEGNRRRTGPRQVYGVMA